MYRRFVLLVMLVSSLGLSACGGAAPVTFSALPIYPAATELQPGQNALADSLADSMRSALDAAMTAQIRVYELPSDTSFDQVQTYFSAQLSNADWASSAALTTETEAFSTVGWQRGRNTSEQVLMLGYVPPILDTAPLLVVSLFGVE